MDNENSVVTLRGLQTFLDKIKTKFVKKNSVAAVKSAVLDGNVSITSDDQHSVSFTTEASDSSGSVALSIPEGDEQRTVATCEDGTQSITASSLNANVVYPGYLASTSGIIPQGYTDIFYLLPNSSVPTGRSITDTNYGGRILTTKNRTYDVDTRSQSSVPPAIETVPVYGGSYVQLSGYRYNIEFPQITSSFTSSTQEFWIMIAIPRNASHEDVSITFSNQYLRWVDAIPDWGSYPGYIFQLHIIGNYVTIMGSTAPDNELIQTPTAAGGGDLQAAITFATKTSNYNRMFQWMCRFTGANDTVVVKPIWHLGRCRFVDALGYVLNEGDE